MEHIAAVVVTYNRISLLQQCLAHLQAQTVPCDILAVNNASTDGTGEWLAAYAAQNGNTHVHTLPENTGGAGGFNHGMRWAVESGYDYVWVMDDDCLPAPDALEKLMEADRVLGGPQRYGFLSSVVLWTDGRECVMNRQKIARQFYRHVELMKYGIVQIQQATFVSLLFPVQTIRQVGLPIKEYFIWGDDIEYTRRIAVRGRIPCFLAGQSQVTHAMRQNSGSDIATDDLSRLDRYRLAYRNEHYTYRRQGIAGVCIYVGRCCRGFVRILRYAPDRRVKRLAALFCGIGQGFAFRPKVEFPNGEPAQQPQPL